MTADERRAERYRLMRENARRASEDGPGFRPVPRCAICGRPVLEADPPRQVRLDGDPDDVYHGECWTTGAEPRHQAPDNLDLFG